MSETQVSGIDLEEMMRRIRAEVARRKAQAAHEAAPRDPPSATQPNPVELPRLPDSAPPIERKDSYALADFLCFHDEDFVRNAYRGLLRRAPDPESFADFLSELRSGRRTKTEILGRIRFSAEGRAAGVPVRGLALRFAVRSAQRIPLAGRLLGIVHYLFRLPALVRNHERIEADFFHRQLQMTRLINAAEARVEQLLEGVHERVTQSQREALANRIDGELAVRAALDSLAVTKADLARVEAAVQAVEPHLGEARAAIDALRLGKADIGQLESVTARAESVTAQLESVTAQTESVAAQIESVGARVESVRARVESVAAGAESVAAGVEELRAAKADAPGVMSAFDDLRRQLLDYRRTLLDQQRRLALLLEEARKRLPAPLTERQVEAMVAEEDHLLDALYVSFEDRWRGTREDIKKRAEVYLPIVRDARAGTSKAPVLDLGCGRGEWIELLTGHELVARGVDLNRVMLDECLERGLEVIESDAIEYLRSLKTSSIGAITGMHIIEHLPFKRLIVLLDEVLRVLVPGGVAILETPNPENLLVGACNFWIDPTHQRPLPPAMMSFLAEARGFSRVEVRRLHPYPSDARLKEGPLEVQERINTAFYCAQDYAIIGHKA